jgi:hypothetical protein
MNAKLTDVYQMPIGDDVVNAIDFKVIGGIVPILYGEADMAQQAWCCALIGVGEIQQLPNAGVDWSGFLTSDTNIGMIDAQIYTAMSNCGVTGYRPKYEQDGDVGIKVTMEKIK